jgi:peptidoglycan hydrolase-like protein with peptidoglycan-binding domain
MKNLLAIITSLLFSAVLFATVNAQTNVVVVSSATGTCPDLLSTYHRIGAYGEEVVKLQNFLNTVNGAKLNGQGYFGSVTQQEVKNFQYTYGIKPTGYQHVLTTKMINDINCGKVAKKVRKVYVVPSTYKAYAPVSTGSGTSYTNNVNLVKEYQVPAKINLVGTGTKATVTMASKTSFWENLNKDWDKIKENYKAYLLVFALVLALFWFLRKAATE